jgi:hypothetical protein
MKNDTTNTQMPKMWKHMEQQNRKPKTMPKMQITILEQTTQEGIKMQNPNTEPSPKQTATTETSQETRTPDTKEILSPIGQCPNPA